MPFTRVHGDRLEISILGHPTVKAASFYRSMYQIAGGGWFREPPHSVRGNARPKPRAIVTEVASYPSMTDTFDSLKAALADRYAIER